MAAVNLLKSAVKNPAYRSVATYIFTNFFSKGISLLLIPVFTNPKFLTPSDNGMLSLFSSSLLLVAPFVSLGMIQSTSTDFFKKTKDEFSIATTSNFFISFVLSLIAVLVMYLNREALLNRFQLPFSFAFIIPCIAFFTFCNELMTALIRNRNEVRTFSFAGISKAIIEYGVSVMLIVFFLWGWQGRMWGVAVSMLLVNIAGVFYYLKHGYIKWSFRWSHVWEELKFGFPVMLFQLCVFLVGTSNKFFLAYYKVDTHEIGIYAIACVFGTLVGYLGQSIFLYIQPKVYKAMSDGTATVAYLKKEFYHYFTMLVVVAVPCVLLVFYLYYYVINKLYLPGLRLFVIVSIASFLWQLNNYFFMFLLFFKAKKKIFILAVISIITSILINGILVKKYQALGDAVATLIATIIFMVLVLFLIKSIIIEKFTIKTNTIMP